MLQPVNFEALYMSRLQQQEAAKEASGEATTH
jgi:preprotein translocase subunit SecB